MNDGPILVFDSGVGGLSVVATLRQQLPDAALAYTCDNAMLPYGTKADDWLVERIVAVCDAAVEASRASVLVIACNTASTLALEALRAHLAIPVVGTVPAIKPAARLSQSGHIALLATSATVNRPYTRHLIETFAAHCRVQRVAADPLVAQAERLLAGRAMDEAIVSASLEPLWLDSRLDTIVLGCTHFPLLREHLSGLSPWLIHWVDSGEAIARRTAQVSTSPAVANGAGRSWTTAMTPEVTRALHRFGFAAPSLLTITEPIPPLSSSMLPS